MEYAQTENTITITLTATETQAVEAQHANLDQLFSVWVAAAVRAHLAVALDELPPARREALLTELNESVRAAERERVRAAVAAAEQERENARAEVAAAGADPIGT